MGLPLKEYRCHCGKLLFKGQFWLSQIEIKCRRCGQIRLIEEEAPTIRPSTGYDFFVSKTGSVAIVNEASSQNQITAETEATKTVSKTMPMINDISVFPHLQTFVENQAFNIKRHSNKPFKIDHTINEPSGKKDIVTAYFLPAYDGTDFAGYRVVCYLRQVLISQDPVADKQHTIA